MSSTTSPPVDIAPAGADPGSFLWRIAPEGPDRVSLRLEGDVDLSGRDQLNGALAAAEGLALDLTVDLSAADFLDSSALECLQEAAARLDTKGGRLTLTGEDGQVARLLALTQLPAVGRLPVPPALQLVREDRTPGERRLPLAPDEPEGTDPLPKVSTISREIVRLYARFLGRGPTKARTRLDDRFALCVLEDSMSRAEGVLVAGGHSAEVVAMRQSFHELIAPELRSIVEAETGRRVDACVGQIDPVAGITVEYFHFGHGTPTDA